MFTRKPSSNEEGLEKAIDEILEELDKHAKTSEEYEKLTKVVERLYKLRAVDPQRRISPDTILLVLGNLAGIVAIVGYERTHVVASKALSFVMKLK